MEREKMIEMIIKNVCDDYLSEGKCVLDSKLCKSDWRCPVRNAIKKSVDEIFHEETEKLKEKIRKETAREILSELREFVENRKHRFDLECKAAEETAKSYDKND